MPVAAAAVRIVQSGRATFLPVPVLRAFTVEGIVERTIVRAESAAGHHVYYSDTRPAARRRGRAEGQKDDSDSARERGIRKKRMAVPHDSDLEGAGGLGCLAAMSRH